MPELVDTLTVRQDVGDYEPSYKKAVLQFWFDGTVTWEKRPDAVMEYGTTSYVGDPNG